MAKKDCVLPIVVWGDHGWEIVALCSMQACDYVWDALRIAYPNHKMRMENARGEIIKCTNM